MSSELKPCPFCGSEMAGPHTKDCYFTVDGEFHRLAVNNADLSLALAVEKAWNRRATPPAAPVQGEKPEVVAWRYGFSGGVVSDKACLDEWKAGGEHQPLMTVAQHERIVAALSADNQRLVPPGPILAKPHPMAAVQGERDGFDCWFRREEGLPDSADTTYISAAYLPWKAWQARAALSAPPAADMADAYVGAREDLAIWKRRALEAEEKVRVLDQRIDQLVLDAQGETRMGEPFIAPPAAGAPTVGARPQTCNGKRCGWCKEGAEPCHYTPPAAGVPSPEPMAEVISDGVMFLRKRPDGSPWPRGTKLYAEPPASEQQQAVVLPERDGLQLYAPDSSDYAGGVSWNACLDEFLRLNPHLAGVNQGVTTEAGNGGEV